MRVRSLLARVGRTRPSLARRVVSWLDQPVGPLTRVIGWVGSTILFLLVATALGGPTEGDSSEVVYGTWAVQHGRLSCVYPVAGPHHPMALANPFALAAPLYPLVSGLVAAVLRIGHAVDFPSSRTLGPSCANGFAALFRWSVRASAIEPTVRIGFVMWLALLAGVLYLVRSTERRGTGWEVATGFALAVTPPVVMCLTYYFHPQDLLAMALVLAGTGAVLRGRPLTAGVLFGLALTAQQFAILAALAVIVLIDRRSLGRLFVGAATAVVVVDGPFVALSGLRALKTVLLGSSRVGSAITPHGGTVVFSLGLTGIPSFVVSRVVPLVVAAALAAWVRRARGGQALPPAGLVTVVAAALLARLVFEVNIFGYYLMAVFVAVLVVEVLRGQLGRDVIALAGLFLVYFDPEHIALVSNLTPYGLAVFYDIPIVIGALGVVVFLYDALRRRNVVLDALWVALVALTGEDHLWGHYYPIWNLPEWAWQVIVVGYALVVVARRLAPYLGRGGELEDELHAQPLGVPLGLLGDPSGAATPDAADRPQ